MSKRKLTAREKWERRRKKRREVEQSYREHTPPQIRHLRWMRRNKIDPDEYPEGFATDPTSPGYVDPLGFNR